MHTPQLNNMNRKPDSNLSVYVVVAAFTLVGIIGLWLGARDFDEALAKCETKHSREVCLHTLRP